MKDPAVIYDFDPHKLPKEYLEAIGLMVAAASQTEDIVGQFIGGLLGIDNLQSVALTTHMSGPIRDHIARALAEIEAPTEDVVHEIDEILDSINVAMEKRNTLVHNALGRHPVTNEVVSLRIKARGSLQAQLTPISVEGIREDATLLCNAGLKLMWFMSRRSVRPTIRNTPKRAPLKRGKKARAERRNNGVDT